MLIVMFAISMSLVLTYTFVRLQGTEHRVQSNAQHDTAALQAARTGATAALRLMSSPNWEGVDAPLRAVVGADSEGTLHYRVTWRTPHQLEQSTLPEDADGWPALYALVHSEGVWISNENPEYRVTRTVEVLARLEPRLPGRVPLGRDDGTASDLVPNPAAWSGIETWSLQARKNGRSLRLEPGCRIDGALWLADDLRLFEDPRWGHEARDAYLEGLGTDLTDGFAGSLTRWPHPLPGTVVFGKTPRGRTQEDLERLRVAWRTADKKTSKNTNWKVPIDAFREYTVYRGGPTYRAQRVRWTLRNTTLQPDDSNPLGIFLCDGDLRVGDDVTLVGTLVVAGRVIIEGRDVVLAPFRGLDLEGKVLVSEPALWPRLPAVMAERMEIARDARALIDGAVVLEKDFEAELADYQSVGEEDTVIAAGTGATAQPTSAIHSEVQLPAEVALPDFAPGRYAVWLGSREWSRYAHTGAPEIADVGTIDREDGQLFLRVGGGLPWHLSAGGRPMAVWLSSARRWLPITGIDLARGRIRLGGLSDLRAAGAPAAFRLKTTAPPTGAWYPILGYDASRRTLTVLGEAEFPLAVPFQIASALRYRADIRGTLSAERHVLRAPPSWQRWDHRTWEERFDRWQQEAGSDAAPFDSSRHASGTFSERGAGDDSERGAGDDSERGAGDDSERGAGDDSERGGGDDSERGGEDEKERKPNGHQRPEPTTSFERRYATARTDGAPQTSFSRWLESPENCGGGTESMRRSGLHVRPTLHIWNASSAPLRLSLPLFAPYRRDADSAVASGRRLKGERRGGSGGDAGRDRALAAPASAMALLRGGRADARPEHQNAALPFPATYDLPPVTPQLSTNLLPTKTIREGTGHGARAATVQPVGPAAGRSAETDPQGYRWTVLKWRIVP